MENKSAPQGQKKSPAGGGVAQEGISKPSATVRDLSEFEISNLHGDITAKENSLAADLLIDR